MLVINKTISRLSRMIRDERLGIEKIYIISNSKNCALLYLRHLRKIIDLRNFQVDIITSIKKFQGLNMSKDNTIFLLCGAWYKSKLCEEPGIMECINKYMTIPIDDIPTEIYDKWDRKIKYVREFNNGSYMIKEESSNIKSKGLTVKVSVDTTEIDKAMQKTEVLYKQISEVQAKLSNPYLVQAFEVEAEQIEETTSKFQKDVIDALRYGAEAMAKGVIK